MELDEFRAAFDDWLDAHADELAPDADGPADLDQHMAQIAKVRHLTYDAGWARYGWPERIGGFGGSGLLRAYLAEALTARDLVYSGVYSLPEVLAPSFLTVRAAGALGRDDPAAAARRRGVVPGVLGAEHRQQPRPRSRAARCAPTKAGGSPARRSGPAWRSTRSVACC